MLYQGFIVTPFFITKCQRINGYTKNQTYIKKSTTFFEIKIIATKNIKQVEENKYGELKTFIKSYFSIVWDITLRSFERAFKKSQWADLFTHTALI